MKTVKNIIINHPWQSSLLYPLIFFSLAYFFSWVFNTYIYLWSLLIIFFWIIFCRAVSKRKVPFIIGIVICLIMSLIFMGNAVYIAMVSVNRISATKTIHAQTVKYISAEAMGCTLGETTMMNGDLTCSELNATNVVAAAAKTLTDKNPYSTKNNAVRISTSNTLKKDVGYINLSVAGSNVIVKSCHKKPCSDENNRLSKTISIEIK